MLAESISKIIQKQKDTMSVVNILVAHKMPAIVPFTDMGNRSELSILWNALWICYRDDGDLGDVASRFMSINPELQDDMIATCRHFTHLMCIHYNQESDDYMNYENEVIRSQNEPTN